MIIMVAEFLEYPDFSEIIPKGSVVAISGFNLGTTPEYLMNLLLETYIKTGKPSDLFLVCDALPAASGRGLDLIMKYIYEYNDSKFIRGILVPFLGFSKYLQKIALEERIPIYSWPIGVTAYWLREIASGRPGLLSRIGVGTYLDPELQGGTLNNVARKQNLCKISEIKVDSQKSLFFEGPKPDFAFIRASISDAKGNLSVTDEPFRGTVLTIAQATKAKPVSGKVYAQVSRVMHGGTMAPHEVEVPWPLVDSVIISPKEFHCQSPQLSFDPEVSVGNSYIASPEFSVKEKELDVAGKIIVQQGIMRLIKALGNKDHIMINLGVGIPASIGGYIYENRLEDRIVPVVESGPWGGVSLSGENFGVCKGFFAVSTIPDMFSNYEGGIIDMAALGFLQVDRFGNVNPSFIPGKITGPGGFPVIAQGSPATFFMGKFMGGKIDCQLSNGRLKINRDGDTVKFVNDVYRIFFSGKQASVQRKKITYITERAIMELTPQGIEIVEIAPGLDIEQDVLSKMEFEPKISTKLKEMEVII